MILEIVYYAIYLTVVIYWLVVFIISNLSLCNTYILALLIWIWMTHLVISMWVTLSWWGWRSMAMSFFEYFPNCPVVRLFLPSWIGYRYFTWLTFSSTVLLFSSSVIWLSASLACLHCWFYNWMTHLFSVHLK